MKYTTTNSQNNKEWAHYSTTLTLFVELSTQYLLGFEHLSFLAFMTEIASQSWKFTKDECQ